MLNLEVFTRLIIENMPMEGIEFSEAVKIKKKKSVEKNILAVLTRTHNPCFGAKIYIKVGFKGVFLAWACLHV